MEEATATKEGSAPSTPVLASVGGEAVVVEANGAGEAAASKVAAPVSFWSRRSASNAG